MNHEIKTYSPYVGIGLICLLVSILVDDVAACVAGEHCRLDMVPLIHDFLRDLGIAVLVGVFIAVVLEAKHRKNNELYFQKSLSEFKVTVGESLIRAIYGHNLPDQMLRTVKETIFEKNFIREDTRIEIRLYNFSKDIVRDIVPLKIKDKLLRFEETIQNSSFLNNNYLVLMKLKFGFTISNISDGEQCFPAKFTMRIPFDHRLEDLCDVYSILVDDVERVACFERQAEAGELLYGLKDGETITVAKGGKVKIEYEALSVRWRDDQEVFTMVVPTMGLDVLVEDGNGDKCLNLEPKFKDDTLKGVIGKNEEKNTARLSSKACLLPYQGVLVRWSPNFAQACLPGSNGDGQ